MIKKYLQFIKDGIFPVFCFACKKEGVWLCEDCDKKIIIDEKILSFDSEEDFPVKEFFSALSYKDPFVHEFLHSYKYFFAPEAEEKIEKIVKVVLHGKQKEFFDNFDLIVPMPLHEKRLLSRGFNQAETIARSLSSMADIPLCLALKRIKNTKQQAKLDKEKRKKNVKDAFEPMADVLGQRILLVDDVFTSGATSFSAAGALLDAGAESVSVFCLARGQGSEEFF